MRTRKPYPTYKDSGVAWLGHVPDHWRVVRLARGARILNGADYSIVEVTEGGYPVYGSGGEFRRASAFLFEGDSVLFGRKGTLDRPMLVSGRFWTVDTMFYSDIDRRFWRPDFLYYWATTLPYDLWSTNTALPSMTSAALLSAHVPTPDVVEQRAIADFLDRETAEIDAFVAESEKLITLLNERRDSIWDRLFAEAVHGTTKVPLGRVIHSIADGPFGSSLTSAHYVDEGVRVIRLGNIGICEFKDADKAFVSEEHGDALIGHSARAGDVIIAGLGDERMPLGRACVLPDIGPAIVKADCYRVRVGPRVSASYLAWALSAPRTRLEMKLASRGSTRERLNTSVVVSVSIPVPSREAQTRLVAEFQTQSSKIDEAIATAREGIALAKERRQALISAAVTGKIDVRSAA